MSDQIEGRRRILATIAESYPDEVITGFAVVLETAGENGTRTLNAFSSDALGEAELPTWTAEGLLRYALDTQMFEPMCELGEDDEED